MSLVELPEALGRTGFPLLCNACSPRNLTACGPSAGSLAHLSDSWGSNHVGTHVQSLTSHSDPKGRA